MADYFYRELLSRFTKAGTFECECGRRHRIMIKEIVAGEHALEDSAALLERLYGRGQVLWVLSDQNTEAAAARAWKSAAPASRIVSRVLPGSPMPVPTDTLVDELAREVRDCAPDLIVSVGSGVISDLGKKVSLDTGIPNWCVATAPSVDAYTSPTSAIRVSGYHAALPTGISEVVVCDVDVISRAPRRMFLAGLGDLLAKFIARMDWEIARLMTGEHYCPTIAGYAVSSARKALEAARELESDPREAARTLTDAVLVSGFAMQAIGGSRPAASAEHTIAHLWEMASAVGNKELDLHGILVGAASRMVLRGYEPFYKTLAGFAPDVEARRAAYSREAPWSADIPREMLPFKGKMQEEMDARGFGAPVLEARLAAFTREKGRILEAAQPALAELDAAVGLLEKLGFPFALDKIGITPPFGALSWRYARALRNRYTTFDLAYELGLPLTLS